MRNKNINRSHSPDVAVYRALLAVCVGDGTHDASHAQRHVAAGHSEQALQLSGQRRDGTGELRGGGEEVQHGGVEAGLLQGAHGLLLQVKLVAVHALQQVVQNGAGLGVWAVTIKTRNEE